MADMDALQFEQIHESFRPRIQRYLARLVGESEAEDLTQDVFLKISQKLAMFRGDSQLSTWIYRIATNAALDRLRSPAVRSRVPTCSESLESSDVTHQAEVDVQSIDASLIREEMNDCIRGFVDSLPADYRAVIRLGELQELSNQQIADILGVSLDVVKIRLHRARAKLRKELDMNCSFYRDGRNELACEPKCDSGEPPERR